MKPSAHNPTAFEPLTTTLAPRYDMPLPIMQRRDEIVAHIRDHQVVVVAGQTGSGKTTHLPLLCLEAGRGISGRIGCTQPRRIAATSIAHRVAQLVQTPLGQDVGYRIRFDQQQRASTRISFLTDGVLLNDIQSDALLRSYDTIIIDEAHERSLTIDFLLGYLKTLLPRRPDLKLIISSATIDTELFSRFFDNAPIIEVSGRLYPVDIIYQPPQQEGEEVAHYIDAAADAALRIIDMGDSGDILVFMPTAQDIMETVDKIKGGAREPDVLVLPLFGRLSSADQNRIFSSWRGRKVVVATNIAETSITVPGIRFVVDTGMVRMVRYVPQLRTSRMPVEPISQASANQRSGRCGRVAEGLCIRLYDEQDFATREPFTTPEIQRTNLAGVILQMKTLQLGPVESFPFVQPPDKRAVNDGYQLLTELGALDEKGRLTTLGRTMARLPLDPNIARMILQAQREGALREVMIIAAALSVVEPRLRPPGEEQRADAMHRQFYDKTSDFMFYVNLWDAYQKQWEALKTQNRLRRFCQEHYLSFVRMREWHDVYEQITRIVGRLKGFVINTERCGDDAIHRSLLSGLLLNVAHLQEKGGYRATRGREVVIFPGSALARKGFEWIMSHEIVETSRVFARTVAIIQPQWVEQLAKGLCRSSYANPRFDERSGTVIATEQVNFYGLPLIRNRTVAYGRIKPVEAHHVFVAEGLIEGHLRTDHGFLRHNQAVVARIHASEDKLRSRSLYAGDEALMNWYHERLGEVSSIHDLNRLIREQGGDGFLKITADDVACTALPDIATDYPDELRIGTLRFALRYRFEPGSDEDGVSARVELSQYYKVPAHAFEWALPVYWPQRVRELLEQLPKTMRKSLQPLAETAQKLSEQLRYDGQPFVRALCGALKIQAGIEVCAGDFGQIQPFPPLWLRVEVIDGDGKIIDRFIPPTKPSAPQLQRAQSTTRAFHAHWTQEKLDGWNFGDIPERIALDEQAGGDLTLFGYPALTAEHNEVGLAVFTSRAEAAQSHRSGLMRLVEKQCAQELAWLLKECTPSQNSFMHSAPFAGKQKVRETLCSLAHRQTITPATTDIRTQAQFNALLAEKKRFLRGLGHTTAQLFDRTVELFNGCNKLIDTRLAKRSSGSSVTLATGLREELKGYFQALFEPGFSWEQLEQYPRYLAAFECRIVSAFDDPRRYRGKIGALDGLRERSEQLRKDLTRVGMQECSEFRDFAMLVEEYAISLFAQQSVKARVPVSEKRLEEKATEIVALIRTRAG